jgi:hypothetical protein
MATATVPAPTVGIGQILREGTRYAVPHHQRDFSWSEDEIGQLVSDVEEARKAGQDEYFLGLMVFMPKANRELTILDGQQRLATASILLSAIRRWLRDRGLDDDAAKIQSDYIAERHLGSSEHFPRLVLNEVNNPVFEAYVVREGTTEDLEKTLDTLSRYDPNRRLYEAVVFCRKRISELADAIDGDKQQAAKFLYSLVAYLENNVKVVSLVVPNEANAYTVFETLNYRGLDLSVLDLIKNFVFGKAGGESRLRETQARWSQVMSNLANVRADDFLKSWWTSRFGRIQTALLFPRFKEKTHTWTAVAKICEDMVAASDQFAALEIADDPVWAPLSERGRDTVRSLKILGAQQVHPVLLSGLAKFPEAELGRLLWLLETLIVRYQLIGGGRTGRLEIACANLAHQIYEGKVVSTTAARQQLKDIYPSDADFKEGFKTKQETNSRKILYLLKRLEFQAMRAAEKREGGVELEPKTSLTVEHILPKKPDSGWVSELKSDKDFHNDCVHRLGNMCLLTSVNRTLGNKAFAEKAKVYAVSKLPLTMNIASEQKWNRAAVEKRQNALATLAVTVWRFD